MYKDLLPLYQRLAIKTFIPNVFSKWWFHLEYIFLSRVNKLKTVQKYDLHNKYKSRNTLFNNTMEPKFDNLPLSASFFITPDRMHATHQIWIMINEFLFIYSFIIRSVLKYNLYKTGIINGWSNFAPTSV